MSSSTSKWIYGVAILGVLIALQFKTKFLQWDPRIVMQPLWYTGLWRYVMLHKIDCVDPPFYRAWVSASKAWHVKTRDWQFQDDDVVVVTYPKSGTHWAAQMVMQTLHEGEKNFENLHYAMAFVGFEGLHKKEQCNDPRVLNYENIRTLFPDEPSVLATHLPPSMMWRENSKTRYVMMVRNPEDVFLSGYELSGKLFGPGAPTQRQMFDQIFQFSGLGHAGLHASWLELFEANPDRVHLIYFEDAKKNLTKVVEGLGAFLKQDEGWRAQGKYDEIVEKVRYKSSFGYMKENKPMFEPLRCFHAHVKDMINKGTAGRGKRMLEPTVRRDLWAYVRNELQTRTSLMDRYQE